MLRDTGPVESWPPSRSALATFPQALGGLRHGLWKLPPCGKLAPLAPTLAIFPQGLANPRPTPPVPRGFTTVPTTSATRG